MKRRRNLLKMLVALITTLILIAGCGGQAAPAAGGTGGGGASNAGGNNGSGDRVLVVGSTVYYMTEFVTLMADGMMSEAAAQGAELILLDANDDAHAQITQVENLIAQNVDVILVAAVDTDAIVPALAMTEAAGIPLVGVNMLINTDEPYYYLGPDDVLAGELQAQFLMDLIGGSGNVVILEGPIGTSAQLQRMEGNQNVLANYPNVVQLANQPANWSRAQALTLMENWLQAFDQIDGVIAHNDEMALGAIQALEAAGVKDQIPVVGVDAIRDATLAIMDGRMEATVHQDAHLLGSGAVALALDVARGNSPDVMLQFIDMFLITSDNAEELYNRVYR